MNRIDILFQNKLSNILSVYFTAGYPEINDTRQILLSLQNAGVDMVEIGIPFSDPMADGPFIQQSSQKALHNGMSLKVLFQQLKDIRNEISIPIALMGYLNPVYHFGIENFLNECEKCGIDGVILPDLPFDEYKKQYASKFEKANIHNIFLITPQTSAERIRLIDESTHGFIYMVSSSSITGSKLAISNSQEVYFERINKMKLKNPKLIGFGISDASSFQKAAQYAEGAIIGTAFIKILEGNSNKMDEVISKFIHQIKEPVKR